MGLNTDALKKRQEQRDAAKQSSGKFFALQEGENVVRVLPRSQKYFSKEGDPDFAYEYFSHYNLFDVQGYKMIGCLQTEGKVCPICEYLKEQRNSELSKKIGKQKRYLYNVYDYQSKSIKILETGPMVYDEIYKHVMNPRYGDLFGVTDGRDVLVTLIPAEKSPTGWNKYSVMMNPDKTDISKMLPEEYLLELDKLADFVPELSTEEEIKKLVELYKAGKAPEPKESAKEESRTTETGVALVHKEQKLVDTTNTKRPKCFGEDYSPRAKECQICKLYVECGEAFFGDKK